MSEIPRALGVHAASDGGSCSSCDAPTLDPNTGRMFDPRFPIGEFRVGPTRLRLCGRCMAVLAAIASRLAGELERREEAGGVHPYETSRPESEVWKVVEERARGCGLVHGQLALDSYPQGVNRGPADAGKLLAAMVEVGVLRPVRLDLAGASSSVRAFRGIGPSAGIGDDASTWSPSVAHLWTYAPVPA